MRNWRENKVAPKVPVYIEFSIGTAVIIVNKW